MSLSADHEQDFRRALGSFATGVTIATTTDPVGNPVGVTASSFNSVSLDPPLVLWSLAKTSRSREAFSNSGHFAIHVLASHQQEMSDRFARSGKDKFADIAWKAGRLGSPILGEYAALFQCRTRHQYEGGDHIIFVGEVEEFEARDVAPLLFHAGQYAERRPLARAGEREEQHETLDGEHGRFSENFLFHLISRAHFRTSRPLREKLAQMGSSLEEYWVLAALSMESPLSPTELAARLEEDGHAPCPRLLDRMSEAGLIERQGDGLELAESGRRLFLEALAFGKALETELANRLTAAELAEIRHMLRRIIALTGEDSGASHPRDEF